MYKLIYNQQNNFFSVPIDDIMLLIDSNDINHIHFTPSKYKYPKWKPDEDDLLYTNDTNYNKVYLIEIIFGYDLMEYDYSFLDGDIYNYRKNNIKIESKYKENLPDNITILEEHLGNVVGKNKCSNKYKNPYWLVSENNEEYYIMYCDTNAYTKISKNDIDKIFLINNEVPTWTRLLDGYIGYKNSENIIYLHNILLNNKDKNVKHKNNDRLDNRTPNLEIIDLTNDNIFKNINIIKEYPGHSKSNGKTMSRIFFYYINIFEYIIISQIY